MMDFSLNRLNHSPGLQTQQGVQTQKAHAPKDKPIGAPNRPTVDTVSFSTKVVPDAPFNTRDLVANIANMPLGEAKAKLPHSADVLASAPKDFPSAF